MDRYCLHCGMSIPLYGQICPYCRTELQPGGGYSIPATPEEKFQHDVNEVAGCIGAVAGIVVACALGLSVVPLLIVAVIVGLVIAAIVVAIFNWAAGATNA